MSNHNDKPLTKRMENVRLGLDINRVQPATSRLCQTVFLCGCDAVICSFGTAIPLHVADEVRRFVGHELARLKRERKQEAAPAVPTGGNQNNGTS